MPKQKPTKGIVKRVRVTKNGKVVAKGCGSSHKKAAKTPKQRRRLSKVSPISPVAAKAVKKLIGYK